MNRRDFLKTSLAAVTMAAVGHAATPVRGGDPAMAALPAEPGGKTDNPSGRTSMNVLILTGSPRKDGNSNTLAAHFQRGAEEAGHRVTRFDAAERNVHPCIACNSCGMDGPCVFDDDFRIVRDHIVTADLVAFATPMYYFGMSSQLKTVIDRFYAINGKLHSPRGAVLLMTYANHSERDESPIVTHYDVLLEYLGWTDAGRVIAPGVWPAGAIVHTPYPERAYQLGRSL